MTYKPSIPGGNNDALSWGELALGLLVILVMMGLGPAGMWELSRGVSWLLFGASRDSFLEEVCL